MVWRTCRRALFGWGLSACLLLLGCAQQAPARPGAERPGEPSEAAAEAPVFLSSLVAQHSMKCLDVPGGTGRAGVALVQWRCHDGDNQRFAFHPVTDEANTFRLRNERSGRCVGVGAFHRDGTHPVIEQQACSDVPEQRFVLESVGYPFDKRFRLKILNGLCLDVANASSHDRAGLIAYRCHQGPNQQWHIGDYEGPLLPPTPSVAPGSKEVTPIAWHTFSADQPSDVSAVRLRTIVLNANRYILSSWWHEVKGFGAQSGFYLDFGGTDEHAIRHPGAAVVGLAISLRTGIYDEEHTGVASDDAQAVTLKLIRSLAHRHRANSDGGWGHSWQSALWAHETALAAWLMWDRLTGDERSEIVRMLESEANRFVGYQVRYYRDADGQLLSSGDTKAEENAWNASILRLALSMMPDHPQRHAWQYKDIELKLSSYAREKDVSSQVSLHGRPLTDWLYGSNAYDDAVVINHATVHPDYMAAIEHNLEGAIVSSLAGLPTPSAALFNADAVYQALVDLPFAEGSTYPDTSLTAKAPGGTIYVDRAEDLYYPHGNHWGTDRIIPYVLLDALAGAFGFDHTASRGASYWEALHAGKLLAMQARHADGRAYATGTEDNYRGREEMVSAFSALAYVAKWLVHQNAFSTTDASYAVVVDNRDREVVLSGSWSLDEQGHQQLGSDSLRSVQGDAQVRYRPRLSEDGDYHLYAWWPCGPQLATDAPYTVHHAGGVTQLRMNQQETCGRWERLGTFGFTAGTAGFVEQSNDADGPVMADAVMFVRP